MLRKMVFLIDFLTEYLRSAVYPFKTFEPVRALQGCEVWRSPWCSRAH